MIKVITPDYKVENLAGFWKHQGLTAQYRLFSHPEKSFCYHKLKKFIIPIFDKFQKQP